MSLLQIQSYILYYTGWLRDTTGSYTIPLIMCSCETGLAFVLFTLGYFCGEEKSVTKPSIRKMSIASITLRRHSVWNNDLLSGSVNRRQRRNTVM